MFVGLCFAVTLCVKAFILSQIFNPSLMTTVKDKVTSALEGNIMKIIFCVTLIKPFPGCPRFRWICFLHVEICENEAVHLQCKYHITSIDYFSY